MYNLLIMTSTVRSGRKGPVIANWIANEARLHDHFEVEVLDLGEVDLPMMKEPNHPSLKKYEHSHTQKWSAKIEEADAFIFVTAEYNHSYPAPLRNALHYLSIEWAYKAAGIVSYGGVSAGTRAFKDLKGDLSTLRMAALSQAVHIPFFTQFIDDEDVFKPNDVLEKSAKDLLNELARWSKGMMVIRENG